MGRAFKWFLGAGLAASLAFLGSGMARAAVTKIALLCGFENQPQSGVQNLDPISVLSHPLTAPNDYAWNTGGYASLTPFKKYATQGRTCAEVRFTTPLDFLSPGDKNHPLPSTWEAGMTLSTDSATKLPVTDWSPYAELEVDVYNPGEEQYQPFLKVTDAYSHVTETAGYIKPKSKSVVSIPMSLLSQARLDLTNIQALTFYLNTARDTTDPVLYIDNVRLVPPKPGH